MPEEIVVGGLYAMREPDGSYCVVKVLVLDQHIIHLRHYAPRFESVPAQVRSSELLTGGLGSSGGIFIGHFPLARVSFDREPKILVGREDVTDGELDGYRIWAGIDPL